MRKRQLLNKNGGLQKWERNKCWFLCSTFNRENAGSIPVAPTKTTKDIMPDTKRRSIAKGLVWRLIAVVGSFTTIYLVIGNWFASIELTMWCNVVSAILYYLHERFWAKIK